MPLQVNAELGAVIRHPTGDRGQTDQGIEQQADRRRSTDLGGFGAVPAWKSASGQVWSKQPPSTQPGRQHHVGTLVVRLRFGLGDHRGVTRRPQTLGQRFLPFPSMWAGLRDSWDWSRAVGRFEGGRAGHRRITVSHRHDGPRIPAVLVPHEVRIAHEGALQIEIDKG